MKSTNQLFILIAGITLLFGSTVYAQTVHTVTLYVDTETVDKSNLDTTCNFGQTDGSSNEDYTITVNQGDEIIWQGVSSVEGSTDIVNIKSIKYDSGTNIFDKDELHGNDDKGRKVLGTTKKNTKSKPDYKYKIKFTVYNRGGEHKKGEYKIDPKVKVLPN